MRVYTTSRRWRRPAQDQEVLKLHDEGARDRVHAPPRRVSLCGVCAVTSTLQAKDGFGDGILDLPTAVANVIRTMPILKDVVGVFGCIDASGSYLKSRLQRRKGPLYYMSGGMVELFYASPRRDGLPQAAQGLRETRLRTGADLVPRVPLRQHDLTRALKMAHPGQDLAEDGRVLHAVLGEVVPAPPEKSQAHVRARRPLGLPHIEHPTDADVEKYHALYVKKLVELFDRYKKFNPDYADKQLAVCE